MFRTAAEPAELYSLCLPYKSRAVSLAFADLASTHPRHMPDRSVLEAGNENSSTDTTLRGTGRKTEDRLIADSFAHMGKRTHSGAGESRADEGMNFAYMGNVGLDLRDPRADSWTTSNVN